MQAILFSEIHCKSEQPNVNGYLAIFLSETELNWLHSGPVEGAVLIDDTTKTPKVYPVRLEVTNAVNIFNLEETCGGYNVFISPNLYRRLYGNGFVIEHSNGTPYGNVDYVIITRESVMHDGVKERYRELEERTRVFDR